MRFLVFALLAVLAVSAHAAVVKESCEPNVPFLKYCNTCKCNAEGKPAGCTKKACPPGMYNRDGSINEDVLVSFDVTYEDAVSVIDGKTKVCEPGQSFKKYCNSCRCNADGTSEACTRAICPEGLYNLDGTINIEGIAILNDKYDQETVCEPGKSFKKYCNNCRCNFDGTRAACTKALCPEGLYNKDGSVNY